jgi:hypothetical protein
MLSALAEGDYIRTDAVMLTDILAAEYFGHILWQIIILEKPSITITRVVHT